MQDADEAVAQGAQRLVVPVPDGAALVVEGAGTGATVQSAAGPLVEGVVEAFVADVTGQHRPFSAGRDGQW
ncbi:hypothetical protein LAUMK136_05611 [Mycobacterium attenuatum]|uniref:Uncharacterized protein n=1 Tax=Mycobacterium attenuatum TaxID=2341086 RepID=A0A498QFM9_9MYCO|nr:hypothetical protein LAUMK136_05611 [Mycobacterium attenuatum]